MERGWASNSLLISSGFGGNSKALPYPGLSLRIPDSFCLLTPEFLTS